MEGYCVKVPRCTQMGASDSGYDIDVDRELNRVYLTQWGRLDDETAESLLADLDQKTRDLPDGWELINDIRELATFEPHQTNYIERGKEIIAENGVAANVRVTGSVVTKMQFNRAGDRDEDFHVAHAETVAQAEGFLDRFDAEESARTNVSEGP